jgi:phosphate transport system permease protein
VGERAALSGSPGPDGRDLAGSPAGGPGPLPRGPAGGPGPLTAADLRGSPARRRKEGAIRRLLFAAAALSVVVNVLILVSLAGGTVDFLSRVDLSALWAPGWFPRRGLFDVRTVVVGTLLVSAVAMAVATPLALGAAMFL